MVSNGGAGGARHFDCIMESFQAITGASTGIFDVDYEEVLCEGITGGPVIINWADQNAFYCKMMFENIGGWGSLDSVKACLGSNCNSLTLFAGATWTGCPTGCGSSISFELTQRRPAGAEATISCNCVGAWPWPTGQRCSCDQNFGSASPSPSASPLPSPSTPPSTPVPMPSPVPSPGTATNCVTAGEDCRATKICCDTSQGCYEKDQHWASCKDTCTPGLDPFDPPQHRTPWSCALLSATNTPPSPAPAGSPTNSPPSPTPPPPSSAGAAASAPAVVYAFFTVLLQGLLKENFDAAMQTAFRMLIARSVGDVCGFSGASTCTTGDISVKGFNSLRRTGISVDFTLTTYSTSQANQGESTLKDAVATSQFAANLRSDVSTSIASASVTSSSIGSALVQEQDDDNVGLIVGLVLGFLFLLICIAVLVWCYMTGACCFAKPDKDGKHVELQEGSATGAQLPGQKTEP